MIGLGASMIGLGASMEGLGASPSSGPSAGPVPGAKPGNKPGVSCLLTAVDLLPKCFAACRNIEKCQFNMLCDMSLRLGGRGEGVKGQLGALAVRNYRQEWARSQRGQAH